MTDSSADRDPLGVLAEEFIARFRAGQRPSLTEYENRLPGREAEVRDLFPALVEMEQFKPLTTDQTGSFAPIAEPSDPQRVGEFRILRRVGQGGMGVVYEAVQESLGRHVALKLLPPAALAEPKRLERFKREAKNAARLHHSNIVPVFGTGTADGRHFYAMQFIAGHPLDAVIDEVRRLKEISASSPLTHSVSDVAAAMVTGTFATGAISSSAQEGQEVTQTHSGSDPDSERSSLSLISSPARGEGSEATSLTGSLSDGGKSYWTTIARLATQVADALAYAHAQGVLHRDIKPANLLLDLRGTVWVTDFGLAKATDADDLTHAGDVIGTLRYMAPERFEGQGDHRADVYALGLTLYELLTLKPAFAAEKRAKLIEQVVAATPISPRRVNPSIPRDLETIVLKAIQRDPAMRYQSSAELADDLRRYVEDRPILARRASMAEQAWRWCRRNKAVASLIAAVLLVSLSGAIVASLIARKQQATAIALGQTLADKEKVATDLDASLTAVNLQKAELERKQDELRRILYASQINQAQSALAAGRPLRTEDYLRDATPKSGEPDFRSWEWHYLNRQLQPTRTLHVKAGETNPFGATISYSNAGALSQDGSRAFLWYKSLNGAYCEVTETATAKPLGRIPRQGLIWGSSKENPRRFGTSFILSPDGRFVLTGEYRYVRDFSRGANTDESMKNDPDSWTLTEVDSGNEIPLPLELRQQFHYKAKIAIGRNGSSVTVMTVVPAEKPTDAERFLETRNGPVQVRCDRWDRANQKLNSLKAFSVGKNYGQTFLSADGGSVYWRPNNFPGVNAFGINSLNSTPWFEAWDVTGAEPNLRGKPFALTLTTSHPVASQFNRSRVELSFSPDGSKVGYLTDANEVVIHRVSDGEVHDRVPLASASQLNSMRSANFSKSNEVNSFLHISDDGARIITFQSAGIGVAEKSERGIRQWQIPIVDRDSNAQAILNSDNKTFSLFDASRRLLRQWDVSRDPNQFESNTTSTAANFATVIERDGKTYLKRTTSSGVSLEWAVDRLPTNPVPNSLLQSTGMAPSTYQSGPIIVRDAKGSIRGQITDLPENSTILTVNLDSEHLLIRWNRAPGNRGSGAGTLNWRRYDLVPEFREIERGNTILSGVADRQNQIAYFVEDPSAGPFGGFGSGRGAVTVDLPTASHVVIRDGKSAAPRFRVEVPKRLVRFNGFDPTGRMYLIESVDSASLPPTLPSTFVLSRISAVGSGLIVAAPNLTQRTRFVISKEVWPIRLHLRDAITHQDLHTWDMPASLVQLVLNPQFSPDGRRILVRYDVLTDEADNRILNRPRRTSDHVWIARLDGTVEHNFEVGGDYPLPSDPGPNRAGVSVAWSSTGRHLAVANTGEVQIWSLESGKCLHHLTGHSGYGRDSIDVLFSDDGRRLFTIEGTHWSGMLSGTGDRTASKPQVHVWDPVDGRELLSLEQGDTPGLSAIRASFERGKLILQSSAGRRTFDGSPEK